MLKVEIRTDGICLVRLFQTLAKYICGVCWCAGVLVCWSSRLVVKPIKNPQIWGIHLLLWSWTCGARPLRPLISMSFSSSDDFSDSGDELELTAQDVQSLRVEHSNKLIRATYDGGSRARSR